MTVLTAAYERVNDKLQAAERGELTFGRGDKFDVDEMVTTDDVLELKWTNVPPGARRKTLWLRLYFSEPKSEPRLMIKLHMECKTSDDPEAQTAAAAVAQRNLESHYA